MSNKRLNATITIGGAVTSSLKSALGTVKDKLGEIGGAVRKLEREQRLLGSSIQTFGRMGKDVDGLRQRYAAVTAEIERMRRAQSRITSANAGMNAGKDRMAGAGMALGIGAALMAPVGMLLGKSARFNYELQLIGNTANMTKAEVAALGQAVLSSSKTTGQSADEIRKAIGFLVAAGMDVGTAQAMLDQIGKAATATGADIEDLAKAAFTLNDSLKIAPGKDMAAALDTLALAGKEGNVELKDMAKQLPVLGSGFVSLKMQGREAAATMGAALEIARKGAADADEAANNMKNFIAKIMSPETLKKAKKNFDLDLYKIIQDAQTKGKNPFEAAMEAIIKATKGDQKAIGDLFQDMQVQNFLRPMIQQWDEYKRIKDKALAASGVIDKDFASIFETTKHQMDEMGNAADRLGKVIGGVLDPSLGKLLGSLTPVVIGITAFISENQTLVENIATVVGAVVGSLASWKLLSFGIGAVVWSFNALSLAMATNPIGLILVSLTAAAALIYKNWEPIKGFFADLWNSITATFNKSIDYIMSKIEWVGKKWSEFRAFIGLGDSAAPDSTSQRTSSGKITDLPLPGVPSPASRGNVVHDNSQTTIQVTQQPGQSNKELVDEMMRQFERRQSTARRSMMNDPVMP